ncbi:MAG: aminopeptidase [Planctomycetes bacterium]|nr:aminopeptidase [Planctomycetota bacterium]
MSEIYEKYAKLLVNYSLSLQKDDRLLIKSSYLAEDLLKEIYKEALNAGAHPEFRVTLNGTEKIFYETASDEQLKYVSPLGKYVVENFDAMLNVMAPFDMKELQDVDPAKKQKTSIAMTDLMKTFFQRSVSVDDKLKWSLCVFPTEAAAAECGMSLAEYEEFVYSACFLNDDDPIARWCELRDKQQRIVDMLSSKNEIRYLGKDIDISFSAKGRKWINSAGENNMPSGEVFTSPVEDSVNGKVRFSFPGIYMGQEVEDISLEVKNGEVVSWDAKSGKELLDSIFEIPGARNFGEAAIGTNKGINKFTKNMLFDEKMGGTIHMAIGAAIPEAGGLNESAIHWDMLADMSDGGEIYADGELIYKNGEFIV